MKSDFVPLIGSLSTNKILTELDISGHGMGDEMAVCVGKMLQRNKTLTNIDLDDNGITLSGFKSLATGCERNSTLWNINFPIVDITANASKDASTILVIQGVMNQIQKKLLQNRSQDKTENSIHHMTDEQKAEISKLLTKIDELMGANNSSKELTSNEIEQQVRYLVGEEFLSKAINASHEVSLKHLYNLLYEQLDAIIVLSSIDEKKVVPQNNIETTDNQPSEQQTTPSEQSDPSDSTEQLQDLLSEDERHQDTKSRAMHQNLREFLDEIRRQNKEAAEHAKEQ